MEHVLGRIAGKQTAFSPSIDGLIHTHIVQPFFKNHVYDIQQNNS